MRLNIENTTLETNQLEVHPGPRLSLNDFNLDPGTPGVLCVGPHDVGARDEQSPVLPPETQCTSSSLTNPAQIPVAGAVVLVPLLHPHNSPGDRTTLLQGEADERMRG